MTRGAALLVPESFTRLVFDDLKPAVYKGGEGNQIMLDSSTYGYWPESLFALHGRPLPLGPLLIYTLWAIGATTLAMLVRVGDDGEPTITLHVNVLGVSGTALFFLLVFRTNASYDRWWEGRKMWGDVTACCRNFTRQVIAHIGPEPRGALFAPASEPSAAERVDTLVRWAVAFAIVAKQHLRDERELSTTLRGIIRTTHAREVQAAKHRPLFVAERITMELAAAQRAGLLDSVEKMALDANLSAMVRAVTSMERIVRTRMPFAYIVHLRSFLVLWLLALPFTMVVYLNWGGVLACTLIAYSLLGLETIGVEVEQPFGRDYCDLPLDQLVDVLKSNLLEALKRHEVRTDGGAAWSGGDGGVAARGDDGADGGGGRGRGAAHANGAANGGACGGGAQYHGLPSRGGRVVRDVLLGRGPGSGSARRLYGGRQNSLIVLQ